MDQERRAQVAQQRGRLARLRRRVRRDPGVERLPLVHRGCERAHRLGERRLRVGAVRVEDVDVVEPEPAQALVEARQHVLSRAPVAVRPRPHVVAGLGRDHELVAKRPEILREDRAEDLFGRAVRRPVVVREVEVRDPAVESAPDDRAARLDRPLVPEVLPQAERDRRQLQSAAPAPPVLHAVVPIGGGLVGHVVAIPRGDGPRRRHRPTRLGQDVPRTHARA